MDVWASLLDVLILLLTALLLGALCERLKQSAIIGYLIAGTLLGPNALDWIPRHRAVSAIAELGVTLLLFSIGLEFSWQRLRRLGGVAIGGGTLQVLLTGAAAAGLCVMLGLGGGAAIAIGAMIALSSTACVLRLLMSRAEIDSLHGRSALGILLLQDMAVVPLVVLVTMLGDNGTFTQVALATGRALGTAAVVVAALYVLLTYGVPRVLNAQEAAKNRELPILLAIVTAVGAAWGAHYLGLSPALGAFVAGMLLAESPFAAQIRGDMVSLRILFVTLFFSSIGMLADPAWMWTHWNLVLIAVGAVVIGKAVIAGGVTALFGLPPGQAAVAGLALAQVGEFSFILAGVAHSSNLINDDLFELVVSVTMVTLFLTPYLVAAGPRVAAAVGRLAGEASPPRGGPAAVGVALDEAASVRDIASQHGHVLIVGFGPAGRRVAEALLHKYRSRIVVIELSRRSAEIARSYGVRVLMGDATRREVIEHAHVEQARAAVVTVPDPAAARQVIANVRATAPGVPVIARARYHVYRWELILAGAEVVVDEEEEVGLRVAAAVRKLLREAEHGERA